MSGLLPALGGGGGSSGGLSGLLTAHTTMQVAAGGLSGLIAMSAAIASGVVPVGAQTSGPTATPKTAPPTIGATATPTNAPTPTLNVGPVFASGPTSSVDTIFADPSGEGDCWGLPRRAAIKVVVRDPDGVSSVQLW